MPTEAADRWQAVNAAFSKQSIHFESDDFSNPVLRQWRMRIYSHVSHFIKPDANILELNAGTGLDAAHFASQGHSVHATDISDGMIEKLREKASARPNKITVQQVSFARLDQVIGKFDYVFSNFGGLNCIKDLREVTKHLPRLLNDGAFVTWVIMPRLAPWEWTWILKGKFGQAVRRFRKEGVTAHLEGEYFKTYYHSVGQVEQSFGDRFRLLKSESLGFFSPPPAAQNLVRRFPTFSNFFIGLEPFFSKTFPFSRWGDHVIVTLKMCK